MASSLLKCLTIYLGSRVDTLRTVAVGVNKVNLFAGIRPHDAPDICVLLQERVGVDQEVMQPDESTRRIQVTTRAKTYFTCEALAEQCFEELATTESFEHALPDESDASVTAWTIHNIEGNRPAYIGQDDRGRIEFSFNLTVRVRKES